MSFVKTLRMSSKAYRGDLLIDFDDPSTTKPPSLAKSAVLAALEEEEREKSRGAGEGCTMLSIRLCRMFCENFHGNRDDTPSVAR
ncbi:hypothetical protein ZHAS_00016387 [Anopheles sinensis]|uniref:Uncharacterized protein n=1 Tax=Anopheles sinensis TaxID=74873 RepID=A0A084WDG8_ANOSI|nr:hypothetical protein ZHAS_00016387 [Anopheles sinensis]